MPLKKIQLGDGRTIVVDEARFAQFDAIRPGLNNIIGDASPIGARDAQEAMAFLVSQLAYTENQVFERQYQPMQYEQLNTDISRWFRRCSSGMHHLPLRVRLAERRISLCKTISRQSASACGSLKKKMLPKRPNGQRRSNRLSPWSLPRNCSFCQSLPLDHYNGHGSLAVTEFHQRNPSQYRLQYRLQKNA